MRFWGYNFRYIPIELISAVYDQFLRQNPASTKATGAYYTPTFLADTVVSSMWSQLSDVQKREGKFFDPACGSGIFLVKIFQRLCQHRLETTPDSSTMQWDALLTTLRRIRGQDNNPAAVRIAAFSLYLALLEQVLPDQGIHHLFDTQRGLPNLWNEIVRSCDFFDFDRPTCKADIIIGNPPWSSRQHGHPKALSWTRENDYPFPGKEIAWAFTWKAFHQLNKGGILAFILPAMGFLHNQSQKSIQARSRLFCDTNVRMVVDFSDLRRMLFPHTTQPAALVITRKSTSSLKSPYSFEYLTPKADPNLLIKRFISLSNDDRKLLSSYDIEQNSLILKHRLHMRAPEVGLFRYLSSLPNLNDFVRKCSHKITPPDQQLIGQGFKPQKKDDSGSTPLVSILNSIPYLPIAYFSPIKIDVNDLRPWESRSIYHRGFEAGFRNTRVLVTRGISTKYWRLRAAFVNEPLSFRHIIMAIIIPDGNEDTAKFITAILNSRLAIWFAFHGTKAFGAERPEIGLQELGRLPLPFPSDLADSVRAQKLRKELVQQVDHFVPPGLDGQVSTDRTNDVLQEIDHLTYQYFGLNDDEILLMEETINYILPATQPSRGKYPHIWQQTTFEVRQKYSSTLAKRLSGWLVDQKTPTVRMFACNDDYAIIEVSIAPHRTDSYTENDQRPFPQALAELADHLGQTINKNFCIFADIRVFVESKLYLVKPLQRRFWLHATALADADAIAVDLETLWHDTRSRGALS